jgi:hypothetical protein
MDANGAGPHRSSIHGWIAAGKNESLLYLSEPNDDLIDIFSVPKYHLVGQITDGLDNPDGIAIDQNGTLYVSNYFASNVTVYKHGQITPSLTLSDPYQPDAVAVAKNGYVLVGDYLGGVGVYPPGATSMKARLMSTAPFLSSVLGVAVDASNNVYAAGTNGYVAAVVKYANMKDAGKNLGLTGLKLPTNVLLDKQGDLVVSDIDENLINIYPPGQTSPSSTISIGQPDRIAFNQKQNYLYVPQGEYNLVSIFTYPGGSRVKWIETGGSAGAALYPAPKP